jgi:DNA mismatch repair protein MutS2
LIGDIHRQRKIAFKESEKAERSRSEARRLERELAERLDKIEEERQRVLEGARAEGELEIEVLKATLKTLKADLARARQPLEALKAVEEQVAAVEEQVAAPVRRKRARTPAAEKASPIRDMPLKVGDKVVLKGLGTQGVVLSLDEDDVEVQAGALRMRVPLEQVRRRQEAAEDSLAIGMAGSASSGLKKETREGGQTRSIHSPSPGIELDLRGQRAEDALDMLDRYLEKAHLAGLPFVRIIHGKGTGKLRQEVRLALKSHPHVLSFEEGGDKEGGAGVTVAKLVGD